VQSNPTAGKIISVKHLDIAGPSESASIWLDALRAVAAFGVFASHWRDCLFKDYSQLTTHNPLMAAAYLMSGLGHQWVIVFFVLSGYLVGGSVLRQVAQGRWSWGDYMLNRLTRLYIVLIPALLLGGLIDLIGLHLFATSDVYTAHHGMRLMGAAPGGHVSWKILLGNYLFLQDILVPVFGTNGPLWSLSYEFWYYIAFPLLFMTLWEQSRLLNRALSLIALCAVFGFVGRKIALMGLIWIMGVGIHLLPVIRICNKVQRLAALVFAVTTTCGCLVWCKGVQSPLSDYSLGITIALLLYFLVHFTTVSSLGWSRGVIQHWAKSSYTLYLVHLPLLILVTAWIGQPRWEPNAVTLSYAAIVFFGVLAYAQLAYLMFEKHTDDLRRWLRSNLLGRVPSTVPSREKLASAELVELADNPHFREGHSAVIP
jgi:peptidoglycan/LPS O-acetylase OafA/YrhL